MTAIKVGHLRLYPSSAVPFGPKIWFRGETLAATLSDGDPVTLWPDISGNNYDADTVIGTAPTYRAADLNGLGTVEFPGGLTGLRTSTSELTLQGNAPTLPRVGLEWHLFAVFLTDTTASLQIIVNGDTQVGVPPNGRASQYLRTTPPNLESVPQAVVNVDSGQPVTASTWHLGESWESATEAQVLLDGTGAAPSSWAASGESGQQIWLGHHPAATGNSLDGKLAEVIGWGRRLTPTEAAAIAAYLTTEYGL